MSASGEDVCPGRTVTVAGVLPMNGTRLFTPPPDTSTASSVPTTTIHVPSVGVDDTANGMACLQEDLIYMTPAPSPHLEQQEEKDSAVRASPCVVTDNSTIKQVPRSSEDAGHLGGSDEHTQSDVHTMSQADSPNKKMRTDATDEGTSKVDYQSARRQTVKSTVDRKSGASVVPSGLAEVDLEMDRSSRVEVWNLSDRPRTSQYPSSLLRPYAHYSGTQQSERRIYNVEVTILTVDMAQATLSGYLRIQDLTPDYENLQTFFTGQIVGGPDQRYSFRTTDFTWGADDKTDLAHWIRFPSWRYLTAHGKKDMGFEYPLDDEPWWEQENVFMRWKEHFLVPDHKQRNIQGASFEGFYYICMNQIRGTISGVYFHKASER